MALSTLLESVATTTAHGAPAVPTIVMGGLALLLLLGALVWVLGMGSGRPHSK